MSAVQGFRHAVQLNQSVIWLMMDNSSVIHAYPSMTKSFVVLFWVSSTMSKKKVTNRGQEVVGHKAGKETIPNMVLPSILVT
mmetsp:Transcript_42238/g.75661  ORF Transcript_42238/g.75661 Transcript_42238/m.75661 type:complete len:82 (+) Transcript_42238:1365-1610(+)